MNVWLASCFAFGAMKSHLILFTFSVLVSSLQASAAPVLATVASEKGTVTVTQTAGKSLPVRAGDHLSEGSTVTTDAQSEVVLTLLPGSCVSLGEKGRIVLEQLKFARGAEQTQSREATLRLVSGNLFFGLEKSNAANTKFAVITPFGTVSATENAGTVGIRNGALQVTVQSGNITFARSGKSPTTLAFGSVLTADAKGSQVTNLVAGTVSTFDATGNTVEQRNATATEIASSRGAFESAVVVATQAVSGSSLSNSFIANMSQALTEVNQALASAGVQPVNSQSIGATNGSRPKGNVGSGAPGGLPSFSGGQGIGGANPANVSGRRHSPER